MQLIQERTHERNNREFVLKLFKTDTGFSVIAFFQGHQVSPSYSASFDTHVDYFMQNQQSITDNLFGIAQSDIDVGMYFSK